MAAALDVFPQMQMVGFRSYWIKLFVVLPYCAQLGALEVGKWILFDTEKRGLLRRTSVCNALLEKCIQYVEV